VFDNRVLGRIFGVKRDEVTGEWRKLHYGELNDLYSSPSIVRMIKSRIMRWDGYLAYRGRRKVFSRFWYLRERGHLLDPRIDGKIILGWNCRKWNVEAWIELIWLRLGTGGRHF
jgi:hypothetical protein